LTQQVVDLQLNKISYALRRSVEHYAIGLVSPVLLLIRHRNIFWENLGALSENLRFSW